ncbi:MAG: cation diffusion facilitator family transporter [Chloroflexi bacterium]|nr:cation diffusion facilitator family transporter [Chloroflexota bacterium]MCI0576071.1 cation diffusion facilitator family transporter [Chloroflexota bacterium]MCI0647859.1 cation diffusion facilitator family transporter [Chloroflexota bacterium]MCI0727110.1 cation diffusion facilitator family transporter [Chloroflexota bacterium]
MPRKGLTRYAWLSIVTAILTILLKATAYLVTGSVGLLSDALESSVNLVAAVLALVVLTVAAQPPDEEHAYGHDKAEYFAGGAEGTLILVAAVTIAVSAIGRLLSPRPLQQLDIGLAISLVAALLNLIVARVLLQAGRQYRSVTLEADAHHLMTDVWTSAGVLLGVAAVALTGWQPLDPLIALVVVTQIIRSGVRLVRGAVLGLMDTALPGEEIEKITQVLEDHATNGVQYHALRTRQSGARRFVSVHIQVPGDWSVQKGHTLLEEIERDLRQTLTPLSVFTHLEPLEDPRSWEDISLVRDDQVE